MLGYTFIDTYFDLDAQYSAKHEVWITEGATHNLLGMEVFHRFCNYLNFDVPLNGLKTFQGAVLYGRHCRGKHFPKLSPILRIQLDNHLTLSPKPTKLLKTTKPIRGRFPMGFRFIPYMKTHKSKV